MFIKHGIWKPTFFTGRREGERERVSEIGSVWMCLTERVCLREKGREKWVWDRDRLRQRQTESWRYVVCVCLKEREVLSEREKGIEKERESVLARERKIEKDKWSFLQISFGTFLLHLNCVSIFQNYCKCTNTSKVKILHTIWFYGGCAVVQVEPLNSIRTHYFSTFSNDKGISMETLSPIKTTI